MLPNPTIKYFIYDKLKSILKPDSSDNVSTKIKNPAREQAGFYNIQESRDYSAFLPLSALGIPIVAIDTLGLVKISKPSTESSPTLTDLPRSR